MTATQLDLSRALWRKSTHSSGDDATCVEVAPHPARVIAVRDSVHPAGATLVFSAGEWAAFTARLKRP